MIAEKLRKAVLKAAMEGKLTEQLASDGTSKDQLEPKLLKYIIKENSSNFEIPENWIYIKLKALIKLVSGRDLKTSEYNDKKNGIPYITGASNFFENSLLINRWTNNPKVISKKGDLLITVKGTIGLLNYNNIGDIHIARQIMAIKSTQINIDYLKYFLCQYVETLQKNAKSFIPGISRNDILDIVFPLPPRNEQKRIVEKLEVLLAEIDKLEQDEKALKELEDKFPEKLKNAIMLSAIQGNLSQRITTKEESSILKKKILDKKEELIKNNIIRKEKQYPIEKNEVFIIPDEWESIELADIVHFTKMIKKKTADKLPYLDVKSLRTNEYNNFRTNGEAVEAGDYAILVDGQNSGEIFKISKKGFLGSTLRKIVINPIIEHNYALLILDFYKNTFRDNKRGAAIPHLDFKIFNTSIVPLPSSIEQKHIIEKLDKIFAVDLLNI